jgi:signal transduction histidine kinase
MRVRLAWTVVAVTTLAFVLDTWFTAAHRPLLSEETWADHGWPLTPLAGTGYALMGALVVSRHPRHRLGWLLLAASLLSLTLAAESYSVWVLDGAGPGDPSWAHLAAWAGPLVGWPAFTAQIIVFLTAPDGHLLSRRWRWAVWVALAGLTLHVLGTLTIRPGEFVVGKDLGNRGISLPLLTVGWMLVAAALIASVVSLVLRLHRARDDERLQLLWIASAAALLALGVVCILAIPRLQGEEGTWLAALPLRIAQVAVPVCVAVAVLRHRLVAIDLILNRTLMFALATAVVAVGYVGVVVLVGLVVGLAVSGSAAGLWPSLLATVAVALAFQPLRDRVTRIADRLAFGTAAAPYEALASFSRRLGESPDPADLLPSVAESAGRAVNAHRVVVRLHVATGSDEVATWSSDDQEVAGEATFAVPVVDGGERLGEIQVAVPPGHALRPLERRLLADLAEQAAMAFRSAGLAAELSGEVQQLARRTSDLAESRQRLITAGDAERSRLERSIGRQVAPHLASLPGQLRQLSVMHDGRTTVHDEAQLAGLLVSVNSALEALREITRGVFPAQLVRSGLPPALASLVARGGRAGRLRVEESALARRFSPRLEAAVYFCAAEATRDLDDPLLVLDVDDGRLRLIVTGIDRGGMAHDDIRDRVESAGGTVTITSIHGETVVEAQLPDHSASSRSASKAALVT